MVTTDQELEKATMAADKTPTEVGAGTPAPMPRVSLSVEEAIIVAQICRNSSSPDGATKILIGQAQVSIEKQLGDLGIEVVIHDSNPPPPASNRAARRRQ